jgi:SP family arabinose:H+ symporter-like MFS transporter
MIRKIYIFWIAVIASLGGFLFGYDTAVISGTLAFVRNQFGLEAALEGWYVSSALVGCVGGVSVAGILSDRYGRKIILLLAAILFSISAVGCAVSGSFSSLVIFRIIGGIGVGFASMLSPLYISEISPPALRGRLVSLYQFSITLGILCSFFINAWLLKRSIHGVFHTETLQLVFKNEVWRAMLGMEALPAILFFILVTTIPRSPRWLVVNNKTARATNILNRLIGVEAAAVELRDIKESMAVEKVSLKLLLKPGMKIAILLGVSLAVLQQFTGIDAVIYYGPKILESAGFGLSEALGGQVVIGAVNMLFTIIAILTIDKFGRKPLLIFGTSGMLVSLSAIGLLFALGMAEGILLLSFILVFIASFAASLGPVVWVILSEIYPTRIRGRAMSIATLAVWVGTSIIGQSIPLSLENLGPAVTFWIFALFCIPTIYIGAKLIPETKGKTLEEIEKHWMTLKKRNKS